MCKLETEAGDLPAKKAEQKTKPRRIIKFLKFSAMFFIILMIVGIAWIYLIPFPVSQLDPAKITSLYILDRDGRELRDVLSTREGRLRWIELDQISPYMIQATLAAEDQRFFSHPGVDLIAVGRALLSNVKAGRVVSGASTLSMQVVRLVWPRKRDFMAKLSESVWALRLEVALNKDEILEQYLNRAPYGNQLFGVEVAAQSYFDKPASDLSPAEAAFLAGLPQSPTNYNPVEHKSRAKQRQEWILERMVIEGFLAESQARQAISEPLSIRRYTGIFAAPHFVDFVLTRLDDSYKSRTSIIKTTLDLELQQQIEGIVKGHVDRLREKNVTNASVVVLENKTGDILAMVGSYDFFNKKISGQVNGAIALRQPGSTLKPFTYALAFEKDLTPASLIADIPTFYTTPKGTYSPHNYDFKYYGPVRARVALACSLNVSAVRTLSKIGVNSLLFLLKQIGFDSLIEDAQHYGLGLTLGSGEVRLLELVAGYMVFARGGIYRLPRFIYSAKDDTGVILLEPEDGELEDISIFTESTAYLIANILSDPLARAPVFGNYGPLSLPFRVAAKTGTSSDFRDIWTIGFTPTYTVGVWVGNFDGSPMGEISGISGAAPIFRDIMLTLEDEEASWFEPPDKIRTEKICALSGLKISSHCPNEIEEYFSYPDKPSKICDFHQLKYIDTKNGLLCEVPKANLSTVQEKLLVYLPEEFDSWLTQSGKSLPPTSYSKDCYVDKSFLKSKENKLWIVRPAAASEYWIDPTIPIHHQQLKFEASAVGADYVIWFIDAQEVGKSGRPFYIYWTLTPGNHQLEARAYRDDQQVASRSFTFLVNE